MTTAGRLLRAAGTTVVDVLYPPRCAGCGRRGVWVCAKCWSSLPLFSPPWCERCGIPSEYGLCVCDDLPPGLTAARAVGPYDGWLRRAVIAFKYHEEWARAKPLGDLLTDLVVQDGRLDGLVSVPLHPARQRERGFNQALLLAQRVSERMRVPLFDVLERTRQTQHQVGLGALERAANVRDAFASKGDVDLAGKRIAVVDDVCTTGATLGACAEVLVRLGASEVIGLTVAREF